MEDEVFDVAIVGGGVMGCTTAIHLADAGMRTAVIERGGLCMAASGVNAGTLTMHMILIALTPYALRGWELWRNAKEWLGADIGFREREGLSLAFTPDEAELLKVRAEGRIRQGAPFIVIDGERARQIEPGLSKDVLLAAHCPIDGFAAAHLLGSAFHQALKKRNIVVKERSTVSGIDRSGGVFEIVMGRTSIRARRVVLSVGAQLERMLNWFGVAAPIEARINQMVVTERLPPVMRTVIGVASGSLSLKQFDNGSVLIGGAWQGIGDLDRGGVEIIPENLIGNIRLAHHCLPALGHGRVVRAWLGLESRTRDKMPLAGPIPGAEGAFALGCFHSGFTCGPIAGRLMADRILDREPALPLFDVGRFGSVERRV